MRGEAADGAGQLTGAGRARSARAPAGAASELGAARAKVAPPLEPAQSGDGAGEPIVRAQLLAGRSPTQDMATNWPCARAHTHTRTHSNQVIRSEIDDSPGCAGDRELFKSLSRPGARPGARGSGRASALRKSGRRHCFGRLAVVRACCVCCHRRRRQMHITRARRAGRPETVRKHNGAGKSCPQSRSQITRTHSNFARPVCRRHSGPAEACASEHTKAPPGSGIFAGPI